jgi:hypothetical protein
MNSPCRIKCSKCLFLGNNLDTSDPDLKFEMDRIEKGHGYRKFD